MPEANMTVVPASPGTLEWARRVIADENSKGIQFQNLSGDPDLMRPPDYYLYIFNISRREHKVARPPSWPLIVFAACPDNEPYKLVGRVPNVMREKWIDSANGTLQSKAITGERWATDVLNPANLGIDIWAEASDWSDQGACDLTRRGLFWTRHEVPTADELRKCRERYIRFCNRMLQQANEFAAQQNMVEINPEHHACADYLKVRTPWHSVIEVPEECPNCGESVRRGVAFHRLYDGGICVIDWKRTVDAGVKLKAEVPEHLRWWNVSPIQAKSNERQDNAPSQ